ncbi:MAG: hypothetical protein ABSF21_00195 [Dehalococcoidia bacterium]
MFFEKRIYSIQEIETIDDLAENLTQHIWPLCTGFSHKGLLFLNDSTSEDGAGEWAVLIPKDKMLDEYEIEDFRPVPLPTKIIKANIPDGMAIQIESITFGWCNQHEGVECILKCLDYLNGKAPLPFAAPAKINLNHPAGTCRHCS